MDRFMVLSMAFLSMVLVNNFVFTKFSDLPLSGRLRPNRQRLRHGAGGHLRHRAERRADLAGRYVCADAAGSGDYPIHLLHRDHRRRRAVGGAVRAEILPSLYDAFGIYLPLISTNCVILGICLFLDIWGTDSLLEVVILSSGVGIGFTVAICIMAGIRENLKMVDVPVCLRGAPITLITAGLLTLAFMGFAGMIR